jgi:organic radical activating enzyme
MVESAYISEIFNSIQGEGIFTGIRQVFIRFQGCPLHCIYCDTPVSRAQTVDMCKVEYTPCTGKFRSIQNPVDIATLTEIIENIWSAGTGHLSLTGGEPLIYADFIDELSREVDYPLYLETSGCNPEQARKLQYIIDIASCDVKLPEHNATSDYNSLLKSELETIRIFYEAGAVTFLKVVVSRTTKKKALVAIVKKVSDLDDTIPLVIQPVTPGYGLDYPLPEQLMELMDAAGEYLVDVRAVPQVHKMMGLL